MITKYDLFITENHKLKNDEFYILTETPNLTIDYIDKIINDGILNFFDNNWGT